MLDVFDAFHAFLEFQGQLTAPSRLVWFSTLVWTKNVWSEFLPIRSDGMIAGSSVNDEDLMWLALAYYVWREPLPWRLSRDETTRLFSISSTSGPIIAGHLTKRDCERIITRAERVSRRLLGL